MQKLGMESHIEHYMGKTSLKEIITHLCKVYTLEEKIMCISIEGF